MIVLYECWQCQEKLDKAEDLLNHLNTVHKKIDDDPWLYANTVPTT